MLDFGFYNMDCMDGMKEFPDGFFDLAIVDPPYGINVGQQGMGAGGASRNTGTDQPRICAPGGGNKTYIPFGGKKKNQGGVASQSIIGGAKPFGKTKSGSGGANIVRPKFIRHSTTVTRRMPRILKN